MVFSARQLEKEALAGGGGGHRRKYIHSPNPIPLLTLDRRLPPRYKFLSLPSLPPAIRLKDGGHNLRKENTEHALANITPAMQASVNLQCDQDNC